MPQRIAALKGTISHDECVPCEEAMGHAIHTAAEAGSARLRVCERHVFLFPALTRIVKGWMGTWMDKICP
jgi:hypothetical protein